MKETETDPRCRSTLLSLDEIFARLRSRHCETAAAIGERAERTLDARERMLLERVWRWEVSTVETLDELLAHGREHLDLHLKYAPPSVGQPERASVTVREAVGAVYEVVGSYNELRDHMRRAADGLSDESLLDVLNGLAMHYERGACELSEALGPRTL